MHTMTVEGGSAANITAAGLLMMSNREYGILVDITVNLESLMMG